MLDPSIDRTTAIALLHDRMVFQSLQPLLISSKILMNPSASAIVLTTEANSIAGTVKPEYCEVTIKVPMGPFTSNVTALAAFVSTEDGLVIVNQAPMGSSGTDEYKIVPAEGGKGFKLVEKSSMTCFSLFANLVEGTKKSSHVEIGEAFVQKLMENK